MPQKIIQFKSEWQPQDDNSKTSSINALTSNHYSQQIITTRPKKVPFPPHPTMKKITTTTLLLALVAAPLTIWAQSPAAGNNPQANPAAQSANPNARIQLTEEQKRAILNGDAATVVAAIEAAGFSATNPQFVTQLVTDFFNQVTADLTGQQLQVSAESVTATIVRAFTQVVTAVPTTSPTVVARTVRQASKAASKAAVSAAASKGADAVAVAQSAARGASVGAREGAANNNSNTQVAAAASSAAATGSTEGATEAAQETGLDSTEVGQVADASNTGAAEGSAEVSGPTPVITPTSPPGASGNENDDFGVIVVSPEGPSNTPTSNG